MESRVLTISDRSVGDAGLKETVLNGDGLTIL